MGLITILLKVVILLLDLRHTYDALDAVKVGEIGRHERRVLVRNAGDGSKQVVTRRRVGTSKRKTAVRSALTTVLVWNLFHWIEPVCDRTVAWFVPFYDSFKTLFLLWMLFTRSYGASILVYRFLTPIIRPYEPIIDGVINLVLALSGSTLELLAPVLHRLASFVRTVIAAVSTDSAQHLSLKASLSTISTSSTAQTASLTQQGPSGGAKPKKKPPPSSSSASTSAEVKQGPDGARTKSDSTSDVRINTTTARRKPIKQASQSNLAATRRVLQELPVPRHALELTPTLASTSTALPKSNGFSQLSTAASSGTNPSDQACKVKVEEEAPEPKSGWTSAAAAACSTSRVVLPSTTTSSLGQPPTPPTGLRNYAFIPETTPQRPVAASLVSPTPRFPGGFSFSLAATQGAASSNAPVFPAMPRVPTTAQMAPLTLSSQLMPSGNPSAHLGRGIGAKENTMTHASVPLAHDDRIVPPPNARPTVRKVSSSRSLEVKAAVGAAASTASTDSNSKKRSRSKEETGGDVDEVGQPKPATRSPRKRAKPEPSKVTTTEGSSVKRVARVGTKAKTKAGRGETVASTDMGATRRKSPADGSQRAQKRAAPLKADTDTARKVLRTSEENAGAKLSRSPRKQASAVSAKIGSTTRKAAAQPATTKSISSNTHIHSESGEIETKPAQRLTRSRTKQNLAG